MNESPNAASFTGVSSSSPPPSSSVSRTSAPYGSACTNCVRAKCKCVVVSSTTTTTTSSSSSSHDKTSAGGRERERERPPCERCARLGRECKPSTTVRKVRRGAGAGAGAAGAATGPQRRNRGERAGAGAGVPERRRTTTSTTTTVLEEKLDDLVRVLRAQQEQQQQQQQQQRQVNGSRSNGARSLGEEDEDEEVAVARLVGRDGGTNGAAAADRTVFVGGGGGSIGQTLTPAASVAASAGFAPESITAAASTPPPGLSNSVTETWAQVDHQGLFSAVEAEEMLTLFRDIHLKSFPFFYIPPDMTAEKLQLERPFLWLNIRAICCKVASEQLALGRRCRQILAQKVLVDLERNLDLLLGLVAFLGWSMFQYNGKPQLVSMHNIAMALVTDLRLDRPVVDTYNKEDNCFKHGMSKVPLSMTRTNEERRVTLATFVLCSQVTSFMKGQPLRWSPHLEESLNHLAANPECPGDELLAVIVKTQHIYEDVAQATWRNPERDALGCIKPPPVYYTKALMGRLNRLKRELPVALVDNNIALSYIHATELYIADMRFWFRDPFHSGCMANISNTTSTTTTTTTPSSGPGTTHSNPTSSSSSSTALGIDTHKIESYHASLRAAKAGLETYLAFPPSSYIGLSFGIVLHCSRAVQTLYRLQLPSSTKDHDHDWDWDPALVREQIDLPAAIDAIANAWARLPELYGLEMGDVEDLRRAGAVGAIVAGAGAGTMNAGGSYSGVGGGYGNVHGSGTGSGDLGAGGGGGGAGMGTMSMSMSMMPDQEGIPGGGGTGGGGTMMMMDFTDDAWLTEILRSWDG
ncbi:hypothetical protein F4778DRAFT_791425 [Xylariomycetidae sp. FL2044]|nr:hypothetical protein F4778DRAFT_791425 [Xylariomycetidae sp. FL2044]